MEKLTVRQLVAFIEMQQLTTFRTNEHGYGCQRWAATLMQKLTDARHIEAPHYVQVRDAYIAMVINAMRNLNIEALHPSETGAFFGYERARIQAYDARRQASYAEQCRLFQEQNVRLQRLSTLKASLAEHEQMLAREYNALRLGLRSRR